MIFALTRKSNRVIGLESIFTAPCDIMWALTTQLPHNRWQLFGLTHSKLLRLDYLIDVKNIKTSCNSLIFSQNPNGKIFETKNLIKIIKSNLIYVADKNKSETEDWDRKLFPFDVTLKNFRKKVSVIDFQ